MTGMVRINKLLCFRWRGRGGLTPLSKAYRAKTMAPGLVAQFGEYRQRGLDGSAGTPAGSIGQVRHGTGKGGIAARTSAHNPSLSSGN